MLHSSSSSNIHRHMAVSFTYTQHKRLKFDVSVILLKYLHNAFITTTRSMLGQQCMLRVCTFHPTSVTSGVTFGQHFRMTPAIRHVPVSNTPFNYHTQQRRSRRHRGNIFGVWQIYGTTPCSHKIYGSCQRIKDSCIVCCKEILLFK